eukprot:2518570-Prorocentrum_lima.AAC.1
MNSYMGVESEGYRQWPKGSAEAALAEALGHWRLEEMRQSPAVVFFPRLDVQVECMRRAAGNGLAMARTGS